MSNIAVAAGDFEVGEFMFVGGGRKISVATGMVGDSSVIVPSVAGGTSVGWATPGSVLRY
jgi:hypothetical protein